MANALGIDMAAINNHRQNREINQLNIASKKQNIETGKQRNALYSQYGGDIANRQETAQKMYSVDPAAAFQMETQIKGMKAEQRKEVEFITTNTAKYAAALLSTPDALFDNAYKSRLMQIAQRYPNAVDDAPDMRASIQEKKAWLQQQVTEASTLQEILDRTAPQKAQTAKDANGYLRNVATGERVFEGVEKEPEAPEAPKLMSLYDEKTGQPYKATYNAATGEFERIGGTKAPSGTKFTLDKDGSVTFISGSGVTEEGNSPLTKSVKSAVQKDIMSDEDTLTRLADLESNFDDYFFTYGGKAQAGFSDFMNKLDPSQKDKFTQERAAYVSNVRQYFNAYRKWVTGAAASEKEMADIMKSIPSPDDSPQAFMAKLESTRRMTQKLLVRKKRYLAEGVGTNYKEWAKQNPLNSIPTLNERGDELSKAGLSDEDVVKALQGEGYTMKIGA